LLSCIHYKKPTVDLFNLPAFGQHNFLIHDAVKMRLYEHEKASWGTIYWAAFWH